MVAGSEKYIFFCPGDVHSRILVPDTVDYARRVVHPGCPIVITRRISTPAPKQEISSPDTRLISPRVCHTDTGTNRSNRPTEHDPPDRGTKKNTCNKFRSRQERSAIDHNTISRQNYQKEDEGQWVCNCKGNHGQVILQIRLVLGLCADGMKAVTGKPVYR